MMKLYKYAAHVNRTLSISEVYPVLYHVHAERMYSVNEDGCQNEPFGAKR